MPARLSLAALKVAREAAVKQESGGFGQAVIDVVLFILRCVRRRPSHR